VSQPGAGSVGGEAALGWGRGAGGVQRRGRRAWWGGSCMSPGPAGPPVARPQNVSVTSMHGASDLHGSMLLRAGAQQARAPGLGQVRRAVARAQPRASLAAHGFGGAHPRAAPPVLPRREKGEANGASLSRSRSKRRRAARGARADRRRARRQCGAPIAAHLAVLKAHR
jgi:hypothetical protein